LLVGRQGQRDYTVKITKRLRHPSWPTLAKLWAAVQRIRADAMLKAGIEKIDLWTRWRRPFSLLQYPERRGVTAPSFGLLGGKAKIDDLVYAITFTPPCAGPTGRHGMPRHAPTR
jgi:hypothetical protein